MTRTAAGLLAVLIAACGGAGAGKPGAPAESGDPTPGELSRGDDTMPDSRYRVLPDTEVPVAFVDCDVDEDCVPVEVGCCNHCSGGALVGANRAHQGQMRHDLARYGCGQPCAEMACDPVDGHAAVCETSTCRIADPHE